jgi:hypothetical protein
MLTSKASSFRHHARAIFGAIRPSFRNYNVPVYEARALAIPSAFTELFFSHEGSLAHKWVTYLPAYDHHFSHWRGQDVRVLEIGVSHGGSLALWRRYFGPRAVIYGIDIDQRCAAISSEDLRVRIGSQTDGSFLASVVAEVGQFDIIIDDGSHVASHQSMSFRQLFPHLSDSGLYAVEDLQTSYWRSYQGGFRRRGSFLEVAKDLIDAIHSRYYVRRPPRSVRELAGAVRSVCIHEGVVFIEKGARGAPVSTMIGSPLF